MPNPIAGEIVGIRNSGMRNADAERLWVVEVLVTQGEVEGRLDLGYAVLVDEPAYDEDAATRCCGDYHYADCPIRTG